MSNWTLPSQQKRLRIPLTFADSTNIWRNPEKLTLFAGCGIRNKTNVPTNFKTQVFVRGIHENVVSGIHQHFETWNMFRSFSLESRNRQTHNCAPIQCTV